MNPSDGGGGMGGVFVTSEARMLSAELRGDEEQWRRLRDVDREEGGWFEIMPVAFAMAAVRRFGQEADGRLVTRFVARFLERAPQERTFGARDVEAVLRGVLGEERLLAAVDAKQAGEIMYSVLFALVDELGLGDDQVDGLLAAAEQAVALAYSAGEPPEGSQTPPTLDGGIHRRSWRPYLSADDVQPRPRSSRRLSWRRPGPGKAGSPRSRPGASVAEPSSLAGRYLSASMLRRSQERVRLLEILKRVAYDDISVIVKPAFEIAVRQYFQPGGDVREVRQFVADVQRAFTELDLIQAEFLIRAALGEDVEVSDIVPRDEMFAKTAMLLGTADMWQRDENAVNSVVVQAEGFVAETGHTLAISEQP